ncbi:protein brambleberry-like isoform X2 [Ischnura elegans]|uniref:protein brambleberry-like isoform X2 n=1 Tax=Ischnura elegans TaxID=197161 RepID=UPI001ED86763|nr:protein brambleberry-like isoform X2 [Ischnura elegans]
MKLISFVTCILIALIQPSGGALLDWLYYPFQIFSNKATETSLYQHGHDEALVDGVHYESDHEYDRFLMEAQRIIDINLSEVDVCYHKVFMKIKSSCSTLTEDELGKLSVHLLNCKSSEEGKQQFLCSPKMELEECTKDMAAEMWNSYRVMLEKARALCFSVRQQLFKALTEMVVNKLMDSSQDQLRSMRILQEGQKMMMEQQGTLRQAQDAVSASLASHMRYLEKEKSLVKAGHGQIAQIVQGMHEKLDETNSQMDALLAERKTNHNKLLKNIRTLQEQVLVLLQNIDRSIQLVNEQSAEITVKYEAAIESLSQINATVHYLLHLIELTHNELEARMKWMSSLLGGTGDHMAVMCAFVLHFGYLILGMVSMAFVGAPPLSRLLLLFIVPVNLLLVINPDHAAQVAAILHVQPLDFSTMTVVIVLFTFGSFVVAYGLRIWRPKNENVVIGPWTSPRGMQYPDMSQGQKLHSSELHSGNNDSKLLKVFRMIGSAIDPRNWFASSDSSNSGQENWLRGLGNSGPFKSASRQPDIDDSSDTDGPLLVERDDDEYEPEQSYISTNGSRPSLLQKDIRERSARHTYTQRPSDILPDKSRRFWLYQR